MKKLAILFSIMFVCGHHGCIGTKSATPEKHPDASVTKTETVKSDDGAKSKRMLRTFDARMQSRFFKCCIESSGQKSSAQNFKNQRKPR